MVFIDEVKNTYHPKGRPRSGGLSVSGVFGQLISKGIGKLGSCYGL